MAEEEGGGITDAQRAEVMRLFFQLMRNQGEDIADNTEVFRYTFTGETGKVTIDFEPSAGFADWALKTSVGLLEDLLDEAADKLISEGKLEGKPEGKPKIEVKVTGSEEMGAFYAFLAMQGMKGKLWSAFYELGLETEQVFEGFMLTVTEKARFFEGSGYGLPKVAERVKGLSKAIAEERKRYMRAQIDHITRKARPQLDKLPELYPMLLKVWQSAKKINTQNSESETWREMVKVKYWTVPPK